MEWRRFVTYLSNDPRTITAVPVVKNFENRSTSAEVTGKCPIIVYSRGVSPDSLQTAVMVKHG